MKEIDVASPVPEDYEESPTTRSSIVTLKIRKNELLFDFTVDKAPIPSTLRGICRRPRSRLDLYKSEILDQWMAPTWRSKQGNGFRKWSLLYAMLSPENVAAPGVWRVCRIQPSPVSPQRFLSDENGNPVDTGFTFPDQKLFKAGRKNHRQIVKKMASLAELEQFVAGLL